MAGILKRGGVVRLDSGEWSVKSAHPIIDMPPDVAEAQEGEEEDDHLERQWAWLFTLNVCDAESDPQQLSALLEALCMLAGVRVYKP